MLNPSTATERENDPTVERCERRARALGYGAFFVTNIFALRATDPRRLYKEDDPIGPQNDGMIETIARQSHTIICAWGTHGAHLNRGPTVRLLLNEQNKRLHHLGLTKEGHPKHPLYISYQKGPEIWV